MSRMPYVQRRANRYEFRFSLPDDLAGKPAPKRVPESVAPLVNSAAGKFKTELVKSLKTADSREADRRVAAEIARAQAAVDEARRFLRAGSSSSITASQVSALIEEHEVDLLQRDEALRREGIGLELSLNELERVAPGMTDDDVDLYGFVIKYLDQELRSGAAKMRATELTRNLLADALQRHGIDLPPDDPARRDLEIGFLKAERRAFDVIQARLNGEVIASPSPAEGVGGAGPRDASQFRDVPFETLGARDRNARRGGSQRGPFQCKYRSLIPSRYLCRDEALYDTPQKSMIRALVESNSCDSLGDRLR